MRDDGTRESLAVEIDPSLTGRRLLRLFERLRRERGLPQRLRVEHGPEFLSAAFGAWADSVGIALQEIQTGEPNPNASIERFHRPDREAGLNVSLLHPLTEGRDLPHWWRLDDHERRPHAALGGRTPAACMNPHTDSSTFALSP